MIKILKPILIISVLPFLLNACSMAKLTVRASLPMLEGGMHALEMETDLPMAQAAFPANIELLEGMIYNDPDNRLLHEYAARAYYGYAYAFVEDDDRRRAANLYRRGLNHGLIALDLAGADGRLLEMPQDRFEQDVAKLDDDAIPAMFWTASNLAKLIDMNRDQAADIARLPRAVALMQRVMALDEHYYMSGPHMFFGVYYGSRSAMLGGDLSKSARHFAAARDFNHGRLLIVDLLQAQYLARQRFDAADFRKLLNGILQTPNDVYPEQGLINSIARRKARLFLNKESEWF